jgi:hypothetical protein
MDRGVSRGQRGGSLIVANLSFTDRSRYFSFKVAGTVIIIIIIINIIHSLSYCFFTSLFVFCTYVLLQFVLDSMLSLSIIYYVYLHCAVSVIGLAAVDSVHK